MQRMGCTGGAGRPAEGRQCGSVTVQGIASATDPKSRACNREAVGEALRQVLSGVNQIRGADSPDPQKANADGVASRDARRPPRKLPIAALVGRADPAIADFRWAFGHDRVFEIVMENEIGSVLLVYATTPRRKCLSSCFVRGWVIQMTKICDEKLVSLQLCHDVENDALRVSFVVGVDVDVEPIAPGAHVLTVVSQHTDDLFPGDHPNEPDDGSLCTVAVCDPGGLLGTPGHEVLEVLIHELVERSCLESEVLGEIDGGEQEE